MPVRYLLSGLMAVALLGGCQSNAKELPLERVPFTYRWVYASQNLLTDENVAQLQALMRRAKASGYNGVALADYKFQVLGEMGKDYFENIETVKRAAQENGLDLYPTVFPVGYSSGLLSHDPNLAEGPPVRDALFIARGGQADLAPDPPVTLSGGDFERAQGSHITGWELQDAPGRITFQDRAVKRGGAGSLRLERIGEVDPRNGNARIMQRINVSPFRQYHLSFWVKTQDFETPGEIKARVLTASDHSLTYPQFEIEETQDWTQYHVVFNSLDNRQLRLFLGVWEGKGGKLWLDDVQLEEIGLLNVLRREGCPLIVKGEDGTVYEEGRDFAPVKDEKLGNVSYAGEFEIYHKPPVIRLTSGSRIKEGQRLRVSFYHASIIHTEQVTVCLSDPKVYAILKDQIERVNKLFTPKGFFMTHDEIRVANWCETCRKRNLTPGRMLADNVARCVKMIREVSPRAQIFAWSDMYDPHHNAVDDYYLVNGTWAGSWEGLPKDVTVVNWNFDERKKSAPWFAGRGHSQILAGYYDEEPERIRTWLNDVRGVSNIKGAMYTTWVKNYDDLEAFAKLAWGGGAAGAGDKTKRY